MQPRLFITAALVLMLALGASACVHVPPEAPELSAEVSNRILEIKQAHLNLVDLYFSEKRQTVEDFLIYEWAPPYIEKLLQGRDVAADWNKACSSAPENKDAATDFLIDFSSALHEDMEAKRTELLAPLSEVESALKDNLEKEYGVALNMSNTLTVFLMKTATLDQTRSQMLEDIGIQEHKLTSAMHKVDSAVAQATKSAEELEESLPKYKESILKILEFIRGD